MGNRLLRLRHHAIIRSHHQDHQIGHLRTTRAHGGKRLVARCIEEGNHALAGLHVIGADVLRNTARLARRHLGTAYIVQQRRLTVIDVAHHRHHRSARFEFDLGVRGGMFLGNKRVRIIQLGAHRLVAHFFDQYHGRVLIQHLIDGDHAAQLHQRLDQLCRFHRHFVCEVGNGNGFRNHHITNYRLNRRGELIDALPIVILVRAMPRLALAPTHASAGVTSCFDTATLIRRVVTPGAGFGRRGFLFLDRLFIARRRRLVQRAFNGRVSSPALLAIGLDI